MQYPEGRSKTQWKKINPLVKINIQWAKQSPVGILGFENPWVLFLLDKNIPSGLSKPVGKNKSSALRQMRNFLCTNR